MENQGKAFYQSKTIYGVGILLIPNVLRLIDGWFGTSLSNPDIDAICTTVGAFLGVKGRMDAAPLKLR